MPAGVSSAKIRDADTTVATKHTGTVGIADPSDEDPESFKQTANRPASMRICSAEECRRSRRPSMNETERIIEVTGHSVRTPITWRYGLYASPPQDHFRLSQRTASTKSVSRLNLITQSPGRALTARNVQIERPLA